MTHIGIQYYTSDRKPAKFEHVYDWCTNTFGRCSYPITGDHGWAVIRPGVFSFKNEEDAAFFMLRWS